MVDLARSTRLRILVLALIATLVLVATTVLVLRATGNPMGDPCDDSYSCAEFLSGGECLEIDSVSLCSRYCDRNDECPRGWRCEAATPTALGIETTASDTICIPGVALGL